MIQTNKLQGDLSLGQSVVPSCELSIFVKNCCRLVPSWSTRPIAGGGAGGGGAGAPPEFLEVEKNN